MKPMLDGKLCILVFAALIVLAGCSVHPVREEIALPEFTPDAFSASGSVRAPDRWWESYQSETLNTLIEQALQHNHDLKIAWSRLDQLAATAVETGAPLYPFLDFGIDARRGETETNDRAFDTNSLGTDLFASYEVDLWHRIRSQRDAAVFDVLSSRESLEATALSIAAIVAEQWFLIAEQYAQLALLNDQLETSKTFLELNELRFSQGQATAVDVFQQRSQVAAIESQFPGIESNLEVLRHRLAVLLGLPPRSELPDMPQSFPEQPPLPDAGIPMNALLKRPDVRSAQLNIVSADYRIAAAIADRFPAIRLTAQYGFQASDLGDVFSNTLWNIAAGLTQPVFDGYRRKAEVERNRAVLRERVERYEQVVLTALQEVENALVQERKQWERMKAKEHELDVTRKTLNESQARFLNGLSDYLPVLTALTSVQRLERELITIQRDVYLYRIDLYQALGGDWMNALPHPSPEQTSELSDGDTP